MQFIMIPSVTTAGCHETENTVLLSNRDPRADHIETKLHESLDFRLKGKVKDIEKPIVLITTMLVCQWGIEMISLKIARQLLHVLPKALLTVRISKRTD